MRCPDCDFDNPAEMLFCGKCGTELKPPAKDKVDVKCSKCGATMPSDATFCGICGCALSSTESDAPSTVARQSDSNADGASCGSAQSLLNASRANKSQPNEGAHADTVQRSPCGSLRIMVEVPAAWFAMGSHSGIGNDDEHPRHQVRLSSYYIDRCTVSNLEYERFDPQHRRLRPEVADGDRDPVVFVSYGNCLDYCRWRAEEEGVAPGTYSLPTEAQWERAARGGSDDSLYPWGDEVDVAKCNTLECGRGRVVSVDAGTPNELGILHMGSNVREWCLDYYLGNYYGSAEAAGPDPTGPKRTMLVNMNVVRGASFQDRGSEFGRCAARNYAHPDCSSSDIGFRCTRMNVSQ